MSLRRQFLTYVSLLLASLAAISAEADEFTGSASCLGCHQTEWSQWQDSHHANSMAEANASTVLGAFNNQQQTFNGAPVRFFQRDSEYWVETWGPEGELAEFPIRYTFGWHPLQQYLLDMPDGRKQAFNVAWDSRSADAGGQRWFSLYPDEPLINADDVLHWSRYAHNWNSNCADCHSTNLDKGYDLTSNQFDTQWSEINVGCEACHGAASEHLKWAQTETPDVPNFGFQKPLESAHLWGFESLEQTIASPQLNADDTLRPTQQNTCGQLPLLAYPYFSWQHRGL